MLLAMLCLPYYAARTNTTPIPKAPPKKKLVLSARDHKLALSELAANSQQEEFLVSGSGVPRAEYEQCNRDAVQFEAMLKAKGLQPIEKIICVNPPGDNETFVPTFRAKSALPIVAEKLEGGRYSTLTYCELERERMVKDASRRGLVLESTCKSSILTDLNNRSAEVYQPTAVMIREAPGAGARKYSSVEVLVESAEAAKTRNLIPPGSF